MPRAYPGALGVDRRAASVLAIAPTHAEIWDRAAGAYARQEHLELQAVRRALDLAAVGEDEALLDVGTGTGLLLRELARRPGRPAWAMGVDRSPEMLARVTGLPPTWSTVLGDADGLPFGEATFDVATASYLLHVLDATTRAAALSELHRVVRPGGRLVVVSVWSARPATGVLLAAAARVAPAALLGLTPYDPRPELPAAGWAIERVATLHRGYPSLVILARRLGT